MPRAGLTRQQTNSDTMAEYQLSYESELVCSTKPARPHNPPDPLYPFVPSSLTIELLNRIPSNYTTGTMNLKKIGGRPLCVALRCQPWAMP